MRNQKRRRLALKTDRLRVLTPDQTGEVHGGHQPYTHDCWNGGQHTNCPDETRYCQDG